jgi:hypothetical protein
MSKEHPPGDHATAFDGMVDRLLTVPKSALKQRMDAHKAKVAKARAANPDHHPGRKKATRPASASSRDEG